MATTIKERPILFAGPMVRALLSGAKTQTRRVTKVPLVSPNGCPLREIVPSLLANHGDLWDARYEIDNPAAIRCPYGKPGDRMWVRETWRCNHIAGMRIEYRAGGACLEYEDWPEGAIPPYALPGSASSVKRAERQLNGEKIPDQWRPSIYMPRWVSRITLEITDVRVQRLQDISDEDKAAEGATAEVPFGTVWRKINTKPGIRWEDNPWVWAITFRRLEGPDA